MSLNWDVTRVAELKGEGPEVEELRKWKESMIWATLSVDIGDITEKTVDEFIFRVRFLGKVGMALTVDQETHRECDIPDRIIRGYIGMHTNVGMKTRTQWLKRIVEMLSYRVREDVERDNETEATVPELIRSERRACGL